MDPSTPWKIYVPPTKEVPHSITSLLTEKLTQEARSLTMGKFMDAQKFSDMAKMIREAVQKDQGFLDLIVTQADSYESQMIKIKKKNELVKRFFPKFGAEDDDTEGMNCGNL